MGRKFDVDEFLADPVAPKPQGAPSGRFDVDDFLAGDDDSAPSPVGPYRSGYKAPPQAPKLGPYAEFEGGLFGPGSLFSPLGMGRAPAPREPGIGDKVASAGRSVAAFGQGLLDKGTLGLYPMLTDALGFSSREGRTQLAAENPNAAALGGGTGFALGALAGPAAAAGKAGIGIARAAGQRVGATAGQQAIAGGALGGAATGAAEAGDIEGAGIGALVGGAAGGVGRVVERVARGVAGAIRDPRRLTGEYVRALDRGKASGYFDSDEFQGLRKGIRGIEEQADLAGEQLGATQTRKLTEANASLRAGEDALDGMDELIPVAETHRALNRAVRRYSNGNAVKPELERTVEGIKGNLRNITRQEIVPRRELVPVTEPIVATSVRPTFGPRPDVTYGSAKNPARINQGGPRGMGGEPTGFEPVGQEVVGQATVDLVPGAVAKYEPGAKRLTAQATPRDLLTARRAVRESAEFGVPKTPENAPYREIYGDLREATHKSIPGLKAIDDEYSAAMDKLAEGNELIFGRDSAHLVTDNLAARKSAASKLRQALKDTQAGGASSRLLEEIRDLGPEYAAAVDKVAAKIAHEGTRFGAPNVFTHTGRWYLQPLLQNANALQVRGVLPALEGGIAPAGRALQSSSPLLSPLLTPWFRRALPPGPDASR